MDKTTKAGVYLDIDKSNYKVQRFGLIFYFSSKFYKEKFKKNVEFYVLNETLKFQNKFDISVSFSKIFAITFYKQVEKRGFKIIDTKGKNISKEAIFGIKIL